MRALIISADNFEDSELLIPFYRLQEEGIEVDIASMKKGKISEILKLRPCSDRLSQRYRLRWFIYSVFSRF